MKLLYDLEQRIWVLPKGERPSYSFGKNRMELPFLQDSSINTLSFDLKCDKSGNIGPLVGIMTGRKKNDHVAGNGILFKRIQSEIILNGGISFVFTPEDITNERVNGFMFVPDKDQWIRVECPLPHLIYNRIPFRRVENTKAFQEVIKICKKRGISHFNPSFLNKYTLYTLFKSHPSLQEFFPETIMTNDPKEFQAFLEKHSSLYMKPIKSAKGKGICRLTLQNNGTIVMNSTEKQTSYDNADHFWESCSHSIDWNRYLWQEAIPPALYNGQRFDFRILAHYTDLGYSVTGVGIRQSEGQDVTTHIPRGGKVIPYEELRNQQHDLFIKKIVEECGDYLTKELGFFGEFSIDAGISENGNYVIYEINSKPMSFDEEDIEELRVKKLCELFFHLSKFELR
ncbi:YheC/YheD family protein [Cytobacillus sp. FJAT-54145]|uniref:YheC/YheD family protein n=1 Tax=Cytobacillus spartinae TaxID=3299023 RepID=A0ABW6K7L8_9BACI